MGEQTPAITIEAPPESQQMDWFIGVWRIKSRMKSEKGWQEDTCTSTVQKILEGRALLESFKGTLEGKPFEGLSMRIYSSHNKRWEQAWFDTTADRLIVYYGHWHESQFVGRNRMAVESPDFAQHAVETFFDIQPDGFKWKLDTSRDAGKTWQTVWELDYERT